jgi:L-asparaginase type II
MPCLALLTTGGTIAGTGDVNRYSAAQLGAQDLLAAVPGLGALADLRVDEVFARDSRDLTPAHWLQLASRILALIDDSSVDGIVVTHGTDTLEETAFALHLLLPTHKPVVLTAAMRPSTSLSADGPLNLLQAARVALSPESVGRGVLVVANDQVIAARFVAKTHTHAPDALRAPGAGPEGHIYGDALRYLRPASASRTARFDVPDLHSLPQVDILLAYAGASDAPLRHALASRSGGIVLALAGHGSLPQAWRPTLDTLRAQGATIVRASRIGGGVMQQCNEDDDALGLIAAEGLNALQARILLMFGLAARTPLPTLRALFRQY